jgi:hypothetical protein
LALNDSFPSHTPNSVMSQNLSGDGCDGSDGSDRLFENSTKLVESTNENLDSEVSPQRDADNENSDSKTLQFEKQPLSSVSQPCDYQVGQKVWTRVSGQLDVGVVVAIEEDLI